MWQRFLQEFTLNGFRYIFQKGVLRSFIWLIILTSAILAVAVSARKSFIKFFNRPITTTVQVIYRDEIVFPAVTLCNFNLFPHYLINGTVGEKVISILAPLEDFKNTQREIVGLSGPYTANIRDYRSLIPIKFRNFETKDSPIKIRDYRSVKTPLKFKNPWAKNFTVKARKRRSINSRLKAGADFFKRLSTYSKLKWKRKKISKNSGKKEDGNIGEEIYFDRDFDFEEFVKKHGHKIGHMIKKCHWKNLKCGPENFTSVLTDFGLCYTFNPGTPDHDLLKVHRAGVDFGLRLQLNVQQDQYYGVLRDSSGFKVMIHDQDEPPLINELGFAIHPGMHTFCGVKKTQVINLPAPWGSCEDKPQEDHHKYSKSACLMRCRAEFIVRICNCRSFQHQGSAPVCLPHEIRDCVRPAIATFMNESEHCVCPISCEKTKYQPQLSYAQIPAKYYSETLAKIKHVDKDIMRHFLKDNLLELDVYFEEMSEQVIQQVPAYEKESLFGDIGGQIGLFLGASLLTILEALDLFGRVLVIKLSRKKSPDHQV